MCILWETQCLVVSTLDSGSRGSGSSPGQLGHWTVFLGKALYSHSASLHPGVLMGTSKLSGKPDEMLNGLASHPGAVAILLVASCYGNWDKLRQ